MLTRKVFKLILVVSVGTFSVISSFAQDPSLLNKPIPQSPDASNLLKFVEHPVSLSTGLPETSIPIYTIKSKYVNIPISLNYHSGGIKVTDVASHVGMGWSLMAGGLIAQTIRGLDDIGTTNGMQGRLNNPFNNLDNPGICDLKNLAEQKIDAEPDCFTFSFNDQSGRFYIVDDYSIIVNSKAKLKIEALPGYVSGQGFIASSWQITDLFGVKYLFEKYGTVNCRMVSVESDQIINNDMWGNIPNKTQKTYYLTKIIQPNNEEIVFDYEAYNIRDIALVSNTKSGINGSISQHYRATSVVEQRLKSITFRGGKVEFVAGPDRCDLYGDKMLDKVLVYDASNNKIKETKLNYKYYVGSQIKNINELTFNPNIVPYFAPGSFSQIQNDAYKDKRLFLASVDDVNSLNNQDIQTFSFGYKNSWGLPDRLSAQRDWWDYYNGNGLSTMLSNIYQDPAYLSLSHIYTTNSRNPNLDKTTEGILNKIIYPTGGFSEYEFEQNTNSDYVNDDPTDNFVHPTVTYTVIGASGNAMVGSLIINNTTDHAESITFEVQTCTNQQGTFEINFQFEVKDANGNVVYTPQQVAAAQTESGSNYRKYTLSFTNGNYKIYSALPAPAPCDYYIKILTWYEDKPIDWMIPVGGIRVKKSTMFDPAANKTLYRVYNYNNLDNGQIKSSGHFTGVGLGFETGYTHKILDKVLYSPENNTIPMGEDKKTEYLLTSEPIYPIGTLHYNKISVSDVDQNNSDIGRTEYTYLNYPDVINSSYSIKDAQGLIVTNESEFKAPFYTIQDNSWRRNILLKKESFSNIASVYKSIYKEEYTYQSITTETIFGLATRYHYKSAYTQGVQCQPYSLLLTQHDKIGFLKYSDYVGYLQLNSLVINETTDDGSIISNAKTFEYSAMTRLPKKVVETRSSGENVESEIKYAGDFLNLTSASDGILGLQQKNAIGIAIEQSKFIVDNQNNRRLISASFQSYLQNQCEPSIRYRVETSSAITNFIPSYIQSGSPVKDARYRPQISFNLYDSYNNLLEQQKTDDAKQSYIWDYNSVYPITQVVNSAVTDIAHTSFEADGKGNWTFSGTPTADATAPTGKKAYTLGSSITKNGLSATATYIVSYWKKSGTVAVNGTTPISGKTINGWTYYEHTVMNPASGLITVSGTSGVIDELRLYPAKAQMTTYTYEPLVGMTSQCDANNRITYYEYDGFGRLKTIRDQDKNVIKTLDYQYQKPNNQ